MRIIKLPIKYRHHFERFKSFDRNLILFLSILVVFIIIFHRNLENWQVLSISHLIIIGLLLLIIPWLDRQGNPMFQLIRNWYIILAFPFLYLDMGRYTHLVFQVEFDPYIIRMDRWLFGTLPNLWVQSYTSPILTEVMQIAYGMYWITIPLGGAIFYFKHELKQFDRLLNYITITFFISYLFFIFFPVVGPRFFIVDKIHVSYQGLFFGNYLRQFVTDVGFRGGAFPSSHVGVAMVILLFMWRFHRKVALFVFLPMVIGLSLSTVYGQYHYSADVLAGLVMGIVIGCWGCRNRRPSAGI